MLRKLKIGVMMWAAFFLAGCSSLSYNAATERREFIFIPTDYEVKMGADLHQQITAQYKLSDRKADVTRLERIGQKLAQVSDRQDYEYNFYLIEKDEMNAFTTPGGSIYFFTGLYDKLKTDDEIAAVLAHEIGHCAARHVIKKYQAAMGYDLIGGLVVGQIAKEEQARRLATLGSNTAMSLVFSAYGRRDEYEADRLGLKYMDLAGYKLEAMITTFEVLDKETKGPQVPVFLRSHPYVKDRIVAIKEEIKRIKSQTGEIVRQ